MMKMKKCCENCFNFGADLSCSVPDGIECCHKETWRSWWPKDTPKKNKLKKVYVAGKYSADNVLDVLKNIGRGRKVCAELFVLGFAPFAPWWDASFVIDNPDGGYTKDMFYAASLAWMDCSDAVYVISGKGEGTGVDMEIERAISLGIPVFYSMHYLLIWQKWGRV